MKSTAPARFIVFMLLLACLAVLAKFILFKKSPGYYKRYFQYEFARYKISEGKKRANMVPFKTIKLMQSDRLSEEYRTDNIAGNIVGFIPLGILFPLLFVGLRRLWRTVLMVFLVSLGFEVTQLVTGIGIFDIDDLILNVSGGIIGYLLIVLFLRKRPGANKMQVPTEHLH
jgi:glycopeptide antibiotics resistance protein